MNAEASGRICASDVIGDHAIIRRAANGDVVTFVLGLTSTFGSPCELSKRAQGVAREAQHLGRPPLKTRTPIPEDLKSDILSKSNNRCCICQTPFIHFHHIDEDPSNNIFDNIAPLCPNCHSQAHSHSALTVNLTPSRLKAVRDRWYDYCENRKDASTVSSSGLLRLKNLVNALGYADHSWKKMFSTVDPNYADMSRDEIINRVFSTSNRDDLVVALETVKNMYGSKWSDERLLQKFKAVCNAFGFEFDDL